MNRLIHSGAILATVILISACSLPLSEEATGKKLPMAVSAAGENTAEVSFSNDKKYESKDGVPLNGDPLVCSGGSVFCVNDGSSATNRVSVKAGEPVVVTSVVAWTFSGFRKVCGPFVAFTPEKGVKYVVVNERIGGKGLSILWSAPARQTCEVSVYKESGSSFTKVETSKAVPGQCKAAEA